MTTVHGRRMALRFRNISLSTSLGYFSEEHHLAMEIKIITIVPRRGSLSRLLLTVVGKIAPKTRTAKLHRFVSVSYPFLGVPFNANKSLGTPSHGFLFSFFRPADQCKVHCIYCTFLTLCCVCSLVVFIATHSARCITHGFMHGRGREKMIDVSLNGIN